MHEKIKAARVALGGFLKKRREEMDIPASILGEFVGVTANTIKGIEAGRFAMDIDLQFKIFQALEIKPYYSTTKDPLHEDYTLRKEDGQEQRVRALRSGGRNSTEFRPRTFSPPDAKHKL